MEDHNDYEGSMCPISSYTSCSTCSSPLPTCSLRFESMTIQWRCVDIRCGSAWECSLLSPPPYGCFVSLLQWCWGDTSQSRSCFRGWDPITAPSSNAASSSLQSTCTIKWSREYPKVAAKRQPGLAKWISCRCLRNNYLMYMSH